MSKLLMSERPLCILPQLAKKIGLNEAIILQQVHYWLEKSRNFENGCYWVFNTYQQWMEQFPFWSIPTIRRTIAKLEAKGLLISGHFNSKSSDHTKWYTIGYDVLKQYEDEPETPDQIERIAAAPDQNDQAACSKRSDGLINLSTWPDQNDQIFYNPETTTETTTESGGFSLSNTKQTKPDDSTSEHAIAIGSGIPIENATTAIPTSTAASVAPVDENETAVSRIALIESKIESKKRTQSLFANETVGNIAYMRFQREIDELTADLERERGTSCS